jgi:hypothetical protein
MKPLVNDEIQHRKINIGRGWDRVGGLVMLEIYLTDLFLGAIFHTIIMDLPSKEPE